MTSSEKFAAALRQAAASTQQARTHVTHAREPARDASDRYQEAFDGSSNHGAEEAIASSLSALHLIDDVLTLLDTSVSDLAAYMADVLGEQPVSTARSAEPIQPRRTFDPPGGTEPTKTDRLKEHLSDRDLDAARRELAGEVVARKSDGTAWDHVREVQEAQLGLVNRIKRLKRQLDDGRTPETDRPALEAELSQASRLLDHSEHFVPRIPREQP
jgi:hypothetical protein